MFNLLLDLLRGPQDPTRDWQRAAGLQLEFELDTGRLNTANLGDNYDAVSFLGPSEDRREGANGTFKYFTLGFEAECDSDWDLADMHIIFRDEYEPQFCPFAGRTLFRGQEVELAKATEQSFQALFGEYYWRDEDDDEIILFYEFPHLEWQVEFNLQGIINGMRVTDWILMADEEDRKAYGVTKPWPPQCF